VVVIVATAALVRRLPLLFLAGMEAAAGAVVAEWVVEAVAEAMTATTATTTLPSLLRRLRLPFLAGMVAAAVTDADAKQKLLPTLRRPLPFLTRTARQMKTNERIREGDPLRNHVKSISLDSFWFDWTG
jgi:membrane carboxypeptidase/penicillin-binding protein PbpC